jgi:hypothetical protein
MNARSSILASSALLVALSVGCSISKSSETISDSLMSPFRWSSDSSRSVTQDAYLRDLSAYSASFARDGGDLDAFRTAVRQRAEAQGISSWEDDAFTCASIGYGLQLAELDRAQVDRFAQELLGANPRGLEALYAGYANVP